MKPSCPLCIDSKDDVLWRDALCRIVWVGDPDYPGFCRVILNRHVSEMSDLGETEQQRMMQVVFALETVLRRLMRPDKINLASLGNLVPHVHWHVIPRFTDDKHFPQPIWATALRSGLAHDAPSRETLCAALAVLLPE